MITPEDEHSSGQQHRIDASGGDAPLWLRGATSSGAAGPVTGSKQAAVTGAGELSFKALQTNGGDLYLGVLLLIGLRYDSVMLKQVLP